MPEAQAEERPCLHCMMVELIDQFFQKIRQRPMSQTLSILITAP
jgi:hypothetical protein